MAVCSDDAPAPSSGPSPKIYREPIPLHANNLTVPSGMRQQVNTGAVRSSPQGLSCFTQKRSASWPGDVDAAAALYRRSLDATLGARNGAIYRHRTRCRLGGRR